jgi:hypothetical protein
VNYPVGLDFLDSIARQLYWQERKVLTPPSSVEYQARLETKNPNSEEKGTPPMDKKQIFLNYSPDSGGITHWNTDKDGAVAAGTEWARANTKNYPRGIIVYEAVVEVRTEMTPVAAYDPKTGKKLSEK